DALSGSGVSLNEIQARCGKAVRLTGGDSKNRVWPDHGSYAGKSLRERRCRRRKIVGVQRYDERALRSGYADQRIGRQILLPQRFIVVADCDIYWMVVTKQQGVIPYLFLSYMDNP